MWLEMEKQRGREPDILHISVIEDKITDSNALYLCITFYRLQNLSQHDPI